MIKKLLQKNNYILILALLILSALLLISGCGKGKEQPSAPSNLPAQPPKTAVVQVKPVQSRVSSALPAASNQFDFSNKKDPFKPFVAIKTEPKSSPEFKIKGNRGSLPIHSFDVSQFKLIGIITGGLENRAMVTDPAGKGYVLKVGMLIGKNDGRVVSIKSSGVDVIEQFKDDNGRVRKENIKLTLPRKQ